MPKIGITMGDPAGIGPEIILGALTSHKVRNDNEIFIYGEKKVFEKTLDVLNLSSSILDEVEIIDLDLIKSNLEFGVIREEYGKAAGDYIHKCIEDAMKGKIDAIVTAPIHKKSFEMGGWGKKYPGHTEMFSDLTGSKNHSMMLVHKNLRVLHVTTHMSLKNAIKKIDINEVYKTIELAVITGRKMGIKDLKIGVAGLNPHASDFGLFGSEEQEIIRPAIEMAQEKLCHCIEGPLPPDTIFSKALGGMYDIVVAMYHDQGHIPVKTLGFVYNDDLKKWTEVSGVNITLGLPVIRTSVDHGTAFDEAGKGSANWRSMEEAINYASLLATNEK